jgi:NAD-dependent dihydropyrimidine dehydrogenase PreA subunit
MIRIDEDLCDGCGECVPSCEEGAIQIIDGKARLVSETYCDGLGACLGFCPRGALTLEEVDAAEFDPQAVERHLATLRAAPACGAPAGLPLHPSSVSPSGAASSGCPGSRTMTFEARAAPADENGTRPSRLGQWPIQLHLVPPNAPYFQQADVLLAADCVAFAVGDFHRDWLAGRALAIACPKLDGGQEVYLQKLVAMIDQAHIRSLTALVMQVPCCSALVQLAQTAVARASRKIPVRVVVAGLQGEILHDAVDEEAVARQVRA